MLLVRMNLALVGLLGFVWVCLSTSQATPVTADWEGSDLRDLEDAFARAPEDARLARTLTRRYLDTDHPALAIAAVKAAHTELLDDPSLMHHLAEAYEKSGRVRDAFDTAQLALARCGRALGTNDGMSGSPLPKYLCTERTYIALDLHREALVRMVHWGVVDPAHDPRAALAYRIASRTATIEMASVQ